MSEQSVTEEDKLKLKSWGLPEHILQKYEQHGVHSMFPWQVECLTSGDVLSGGNLVYSAPTSAGKTLVAEIISLQTVLERKKKVIIILPFVSVVREKMFYFQDILSNSGIRVEGFMGSYNPPGGFKGVHMAICTIEKANNLINKLMEENDLAQIGCIVVDELHLLGDPHRGYLLELLLTKIKYITKRDSGVKIQLVGMSATLPNLDLLAKWLDATLYKTDFRPIPLKEYLKVEKSVYKASDLNIAFEVEPYFEIKSDPGDVIFLCIDTILMGYSVLVFCSTKNWCETLAQQISAEIKRLGNEKTEVGKSIREQLNSDGIVDILERLKRCPVGLDGNLGRSVSFGVSFHHAGLTLDERDIIEGGFKENILRVIVATSTLSSGVNLPARRVIVRSPGFQGRPLDILTYKQMVGRAGRLGKDTKGESYLVCSEKEKNLGLSLVQSDLPPVTSSLGVGDLSNSLKRAILEVIGSGVVESKEELETYAKCTLLSASLQDVSELVPPLTSCLLYLEKNEFVKSLPGGVLESSALAEAALSASLHPDQAIKLLSELYKAGKSFVLNNDLHAIYQVTPYSICDQWSTDWVKIFSIWESLSEDMHFVGQLVGVEDRFLVKAMRSNINVNSSEYAQKASIHKRFFIALTLQELINEVPLNKVASKYGCNKGMLQSLQQSASTFAVMVKRFCGRLGWGSLEVILEYLSDRIHFGVQKCLLDLLRLDSLTPITARALYNAGISKLAELASAKPRTIELALKKAVPFLSENIDNFEKRNLRCIWVTGKSGFTEAEAASFFIKEARNFILKEMGLNAASWSDGLKEEDSMYDSSTLNPFVLSKGTIKQLSLGLTPNTTKHSKKSLSSQKKASLGTMEVLDGRKSLINNLSLLNTPDGQEFLKNNLSLKGDMVPVDKSTPKSSEKESVNRVVESPELSNKDPFDTLDKIEFTIDSDKETSLNENLNCNSSKNECNRIEDNFKVPDIIGQKNINKNEILPEILFKDMVQNEISYKKVEIDGDISKSRNSLDIFFDSFNQNPCDISIVKCEKSINIDEFDSNWGGESLLEVSHLLENLSQINTGTKRKLNNLSNTSDHEWVKRIRWSDSFADVEHRGNPPGNKNDAAPFKEKIHFSAFDDTFEVNSYINRITDMKLCDEGAISKYVVKPDSEDTSFNSDKSIIESPNDNTKDSSVRLQFSNILKSTTISEKSLNNPQVNNLRSPNTLKLLTGKHSVPHTDSTITNSYLQKAFSDSFDKCQSGILNENDPPLEFNSAFKLLNSVNGVTPRKKLISNSQDFFSTPKQQKDTNDGEIKDHLNNMIDLNKSKKSTLQSPNSKLGAKTVRELLMSPCRKKNKMTDSPSKYTPLNIKIHKPVTPEKGSNSPHFISPSKKNDKSEQTSTNATVNNQHKNNVSANCPNMIINVCENEKVFEEFKNHLNMQKDIAFSLDINKENKSSHAAAKIGSKIVKKLCFPAPVQRYTFNGVSIDGISIYWGSKIFYINLLCPENFCMENIRNLFLRRDLVVCCFNIKDVIKLLYNNCQIVMNCQLKDPGVADWLLNPQENSYSLNHLIKEYLKDLSTAITNLKNQFSEVVIFWYLQLELDKLLLQKSLHNIFSEVEMPIIKILASMEISGMGFDRIIANSIWESLDSILKDLEEEAFNLAKRKFSLGSRNDITKVKQALCINIDNEKNHPFMVVLRDWRKLHSLKTRNMSPFLVNFNKRIFSLNETRTATGRIINHQPSLQLIPRQMVIKNVVFNFRSAFVPRPGNKLVAADYCQLELRILAHFSRDEILLCLFRNTKDVFKSIAANWNNISEEQVTEDMRQQVKQICYGLIYGMGDAGLGEVLGVPVTEASSLSAKFKRSYPGVQKFIDTTIESCRECGFVTTLSNRRRYLPNINSTNRAVRRRGERQAINSMIQGSACDIAKQALVQIESSLSKSVSQRPFAASDSITCHLVHHLHDEFIYEVSQELVHPFTSIIKDSMEDAIKLSVPLPVKVRIGTSWGDLKPI